MTAVHVRISTLSSSVSPEHRAQSLSRDCAAAVPAISRIAARLNIGTDCRTTRELRTIGKVSRRRASLDVAGYWYQAEQGRIFRQIARQLRVCSISGINESPLTTRLAA